MRTTASLRGASAAILVAAMLLALPRSGVAGDGIRPRSVVSWPQDTPCLTVVDRSEGSVWNLAYEIPAEDPAPGETISDDEVPDGRRQQFFAFSTDVDPRVALPQWITWADVTRAADLGLTDPDVDADEVLEVHPMLGSVFVRLNDDDDRRPITFAAAAIGVNWDTTAVDPGAWVIRAYTWDPWPNVWARPRFGVVAIVDGPDPSLHGPALAVDADRHVLYRDEVGRLVGCIRAMEGTTIAADWALLAEPDGAWTSIGSAELVEDAFDISFAPPEIAWGQFVIARVVATDPRGRSYVAYVPEAITILSTDAPGGCIDDDACSETGDETSSDPASSTSGTTAGQTNDGDGATSTSPAQDDGGGGRDDGCGCTAPERRAPIWAIVLLLLVPRTVTKSSRPRSRSSRAPTTPSSTARAPTPTAVCSRRSSGPRTP